MKSILVYDSDHPGAVQNKCFERAYATQGPGHGFTVELAERARANGFEIETADIFLEKGYAKITAFCITDMNSARTNRLLRSGAIPMICFSTESPLIARDFYVNIKKLAGRFIHNIQFRGTAERFADTGTQFSVMYYPIDRRVALPYSNWKDKKFLILVNRNKRMFRGSAANVKDMAWSILSRVKVSLQKMIDPWIRSREIYKDRIEAIYHFSKNDGFHLYGQGWESNIPGFSNRYHEAAKKVFLGSILPDEKLKVMNRYKFSICFENCVFPGYVTEKIFDCFLAACIPVYYGAPDIEDFVPPDTFIDYRKFKNFDALENYLINFTEKEAIKMNDSAKVFLASRDFDKYYTSNVIEGILDRIKSYQNDHNPDKNGIH